MPEMLLTVEQAAERLQLHPDSVRRQLKRGTMRGIKRGTRWRVPESAVEESTPPELQRDYTRPRSIESAIGDTPQARAKAILEALESGDKARRNAAIIQLAKSDEQTVEIVTEAAAHAVKEWDGPDDDFADWRALDAEPFHFPEESPDYLKGLYRADRAEKENA
jgi:excisionase family DNA binding protein